MDEDLKLVERLTVFTGTLDYMEDVELITETAATITHLHAEIERLKSDVSDLVRAGSDEATANERLREALRPFANAYAALNRSGYLVAPNGAALMYDPQDPKFLGPFIEDLARAHRVYEGGQG